MNIVSSEVNQQRIVPLANVLDNDGDLWLPPIGRTFTSFEMNCPEETTLRHTGFQLWRAAYLLSDWLCLYYDDWIENSIVLELGCGCGCIPTLLMQWKRNDDVKTRTIYWGTDVDQDTLNKAKENVIYNSLKQDGEENVYWACIDWTCLDEWKHLPLPDWILASDIFYDEDGTHAFLNFIYYGIMKKSNGTIRPKCWIALEKRITFCAARLENVMMGYDTFIERLCTHVDLTYVIAGSVPMVVECGICTGRQALVARRMSLADIPQYVTYERNAQLEMWEILAVVE